MNDMSRTATLLAISAALLTTACGSAAAQQPVQLPDTAPLAMPAAPSHIVVPAAPEPPPAPVVDTPASQVALPPAAGGGVRPQVTPPPRPVAPPATPPSTPQTTAPAAPAPLPAAPNQGELEQQARALVQSADQTLDKIDYKALSMDGRAQYDTAKRFLTQAGDALKARNIVYAWQLANKANTIATLLK